MIDSVHDMFVLKKLRCYFTQHFLDRLRRLEVLAEAIDHVADKLVLLRASCQIRLAAVLTHADTVSVNVRHQEVANVRVTLVP